MEEKGLIYEQASKVLCPVKQPLGKSNTDDAEQVLEEEYQFMVG